MPREHNIRTAHIPPNSVRAHIPDHHAFEVGMSRGAVTVVIHVTIGSHEQNTVVRFALLVPDQTHTTMFAACHAHVAIAIPDDIGVWVSLGNQQFFDLGIFCEFFDGQWDPSRRTTCVFALHRGGWLFDEHVVDIRRKRPRDDTGVEELKVRNFQFAIGLELGTPR